ncbi:MAG TPA: hypothetical protein VHF91_08515, partial [Acidimicrobiales bacterium]|nr:hypothetical protein [Acidimicrobiales bacterium]
MVLGGLLISSPAPVGAAPLSGQPFAAYGSGASVVLEALGLGNTTVANVIAASSGGGVNSTGLNTSLINEFGINIAPATPGKNALGRGTGLEAGLVTPDPQQETVNQLLLSGLAVATAPPPSPLVTQEIPLNLNPVAFASVLRGQAQATYDPTFCPVGRPLTYGLGQASNLEVLNTGASNPQSGFEAPLLGTSIEAFGTPRGVSQSRTVTYLRANGDGTFGVVSETRQTVAPISLLANETTDTAVTIEIVGELGLRVAASGKPGGSSVEYLGNPVLTITTTTLGVPAEVISISLEDLLGQDGLTVDLLGLGTVSLGAPPRALNGAPGSAPALAADGTSASGAVDTLRLTLGGGLLGDLVVADLALGHMEGAVTVPAGGLTCDIPVSKTASIDPVTVGQEFTYTISIPANAAQYQALFNCDLIGISATDTVETESGNPRITLLSASNGGVIQGNRVTWPNLGNYTLGQEPITLTITALIPTNSGAGVLRDTVKVDATLGNCRGGATGEDIVQGGAQLNNSAITGSVTLI